MEGIPERALSEDPRPGGGANAHRPREPVARDGAPAAGRKRARVLARGCVMDSNGRVARTEDVFDLHAEALNPDRPADCFDESPISASAS